MYPYGRWFTSGTRGAGRPQASRCARRVDGNPHTRAANRYQTATATTQTTAPRTIPGYIPSAIKRGNFPRT